MKTYSPQEMQLRIRIRNVEKHLRIADATTGHEREVHLAKAAELGTKYGLLESKTKSLFGKLFSK